MTSFNFEFGYRKGGKPWYHAYATDPTINEMLNEYVAEIAKRYL